MICSFLNQKGGVGKTTISINVAAYFAIQGKKVLLVDADKQSSSSTWAGLRETTPFQVISIARDNLAKDVIEMSRDYDVTIIDGPPHAESIARACIIASDIVLIPIEPSGLSTWASELTVRQIQEAQILKENLKCGFVISRKIGNTVLGREIRAMAAEIGIPIFDAAIEQRIAYAESLTMGQTIFEWSADSVASQEITTLTKEIINHVQILHTSPST